MLAFAGIHSGQWHERRAVAGLPLAASGAPNVVVIVVDTLRADHVSSYGYARPTKTAYDVFAERTGVCRDFAHLALTFCRCLHIPARYATGYLGDIGVPAREAIPVIEALLKEPALADEARAALRRLGVIEKK